MVIVVVVETVSCVVVATDSDVAVLMSVVVVMTCHDLLDLASCLPHRHDHAETVTLTCLDVVVTSCHDLEMPTLHGDL